MYHNLIHIYPGDHVKEHSWKVFLDGPCLMCLISWSEDV